MIKDTYVLSISVSAVLHLQRVVVVVVRSLLVVRLQGAIRESKVKSADVFVVVNCTPSWRRVVALSCRYLRVPVIHVYVLDFCVPRESSIEDY